jgi:dihydroxyacetone kinase-like protein
MEESNEKKDALRSLAQSMVLDISGAIVSHRDQLGELDAKTGDGDHGINMAKGFTLCRDRVDRVTDLRSAFRMISDTLFLEIGGSMGPLYGVFFGALSDQAPFEPRVVPEELLSMLDAGYQALLAVGGAEPGDKTMLDALYPALEAVRAGVSEGLPLYSVLDRMKAAAINGRDATSDMVAKVGRASRLGERSRGSVDAGAASCCLILCAMADAMARNAFLEGVGT